MAKSRHKFICPDWVIHELNNWSRWCWRGAYPHPIPPRQCASLEGGYSRFGEDTDSEAIDKKPIPCNEINAKIVQGVYETLPYLPQQVLRAEYPQRSERKRVIHVGRVEYEMALNLALFRVMVALEHVN